MDAVFTKDDSKNTWRGLVYKSQVSRYLNCQVSTYLGTLRKCGGACTEDNDSAMKNDN